jgi:hypothetical protein
MADIKIPGIGPVDKKKALAIGAVTLGIVGVAWLRYERNKGNAVPAPVDATDSTDASTDTSGDNGSDLNYDDGSGDSGYEGDYGSTGGDEFDTGGFDAAGYPLGSQADLAWQAQQDGTSVGTGAPTTASQWVEDAEQQLGNTSDVSTALAKVLGGLTVTTAQANIFKEALGIVGPVPGGYPPIHTSDTSGHPGTPKPKKKTITANGNQTLQQIAVSNGTTEANVVLWNKSLAPYVGTGKHVKRGTKVVV